MTDRTTDKPKHPCSVCGYAFENPRGIRACPKCLEREQRFRQQLPEFFARAAQQKADEVAAFWEWWFYGDVDDATIH